MGNINKMVSTGLTPRQLTNRRLVRGWLYIVSLLLIAIVLVGGATRMTGSGLSITEWKPIHGIVPPVGQAEWQEEFEKYQQIAQFQHVNRDMSLDEFKHIFWWEWVHRLLARIVLVLFVFVPLVFFWVTKRLEKTVQWRLLGILLLGGFQGGIGWWMVSSGLGNSQLTSVSQYRLAAHLIIACILIVAVFTLARRLAHYTARPAPHNMQIFAGWLVFFVLFQIYLGALVAGLHAGKLYNTWPLMDGSFIPDGLLMQQPWWRNFFENALTVQFIHRFFAYFLLVVAVIHMVRLKKLTPETPHARRSVFLLVLIVVQALVGIVTLLTEVQITWGLFHQGFALVVLLFAVAHWVGAKGALAAPR